MKILYLHGWHSVVGGVKPTTLRSHGHDVIEPALDHGNFQRALDTARQAFDRHQPDVVVPFQDSVDWLAASGLPETALIEVGRDHRLSDPEPLEALVRVIEGAG